MKKIQSILVPIDFSDTATNALKYAIALGEKLSAEVHVVNVFFGMTEPNFGLLPMATLERDRTEEAMKAFLERFEKETGKKTNLKHEIYVGVPQDVIVELSKTGEYDLIVMGSTGAHDVVDKWIGTVSSSVAQFALCPMILVPKNAVYEDIQKILYASDYESAKVEPMQEVVKFARMIGAAVHFVHINDTYLDEEALREYIFEQVLNEDTSVAFEIFTVEDKSVLHGIEKYAFRNGINLVTVVTQHRSFFSRLLHKSFTRQIALNIADLPLMVIHI